MTHIYTHAVQRWHISPFWANTFWGTTFTYARTATPHLRNPRVGPAVNIAARLPYSPRLPWTNRWTRRKETMSRKRPPCGRSRRSTWPQWCVKRLHKSIESVDIEKIWDPGTVKMIRELAIDIHAVQRWHIVHMRSCKEHPLCVSPEERVTHADRDAVGAP